MPAKKPLKELITFGSEFPNSVLAPMIKLAEKFEPYEGLLRVDEGSQADFRAQLDILEADRFFTSEFHSLVDAASVSINDFAVQVLDRAGTNSRFTRRFTRAQDSIALRLHSDGRLLAKWAFTEIVRGSLLANFETLLKRLGYAEAYAMTRSTFDTPRDAQSDQVYETRYGWYQVAERARYAPNIMVNSGYSTEEIADFMRSLEFEPLKAGTLIELPPSAGKTLDARGYTVLFQVPETPGGVEIGFIHVLDITQKKFVGTCGISRITGELTFVGVAFLSVKRAFTLAGAELAYRNFRNAVLYFLFTAVEDGLLTERKFASFSKVPVDELVDKAEEAVDESILDDTENAYTYVPYVPRTVKPEELDTAQESVGELDEFVDDGEVPEVNPSWRQIMSAFERCGVQVTYARHHPLLTMNNIRCGFVNKHDTDERRNKRITLKALLKLRIYREEFFAQL